MLHLLTEDHKEKILKEYQRRAWVVFSLGIIAVVVVSTLFMVPVYIMTYSRYSEAVDIKKNLDKEIAIREDAGVSQNIKDMSSSLSALSMFDKNDLPSVYIEKISKIKPSDVRINKILFTPSEGSNTAIDISGKARTRASLVEFTERLKKENIFENINIPISNFAKDSNIDFSVKLIIKKNEKQ